MMRASRRFRKMAKYSSDVQKILDEIMNNVSRGRSKKKEVSTSSHTAQVLFNVCNLTEYQISKSFQIYEIFNN